MSSEKKSLRLRKYKKILNEYKKFQFLHKVATGLIAFTTLAMIATTLMAFSIIPAVIPIALLLAIGLSIITPSILVFFTPIIANRKKTSAFLNQQEGMGYGKTSYAIFIIPLLIAVLVGVGIAITLPLTLSGFPLMILIPLTIASTCSANVLAFAVTSVFSSLYLNSKLKESGKEASYTSSTNSTSANSGKLLKLLKAQPISWFIIGATVGLTTLIPGILTGLPFVILLPLVIANALSSSMLALAFVVWTTKASNPPLRNYSNQRRNEGSISESSRPSRRSTLTHSRTSTRSSRASTGNFDELQLVRISRRSLFAANNDGDTLSKSSKTDSRSVVNHAHH